MSKLHLVTGYMGEEHIQSADQGSFNASFFGGGEYVMEAGNQFEASIMDNNTVRILDGDALMKGRHLRIEPNTYADVTIQTGTAGVNRNDLIVFQYDKDTATGIEDSNIVVIKGTETEGTATDPTYTDGDILGGATFNQMPMYRVKVEGVVLTGIEPLFTVIPTYKTLAEKYARQFQEACDTYIGLLNILDTMEEVEANTQEGQLAGALALKELSAEKVSKNSDAALNSVSLGGSSTATIKTHSNGDIAIYYRNPDDGSRTSTTMGGLINNVNSKLPKAGGQITGNITGTDNNFTIAATGDIKSDRWGSKWLSTVVTELTNLIKEKLPLSGGTMTGNINTQTIIPKTANTYHVGTSDHPFATVRAKNFICNDVNNNLYAQLKITTEGTTSVKGYTDLWLGNNVATGNVGNSLGRIVLCNEGGKYTIIQDNSGGTSNRTVTLPNASGFIPVASVSGTTLTINF